MDILMNLIKRKQDEVSQPKPKKYMRRGEKEALSKVVGKDDADSDEDEQPETGTTDTRTASERRRDDTMKQREKEEDEKERTAQKKARDIKEAAAASNMVQRAEPEPEKVYAPMATSIYGQADGDAGAPVFDRPSLHSPPPSTLVPSRVLCVVPTSERTAHEYPQHCVASAVLCARASVWELHRRQCVRAYASFTCRSLSSASPTLSGPSGCASRKCSGRPISPRKATEVCT